MINFMEGNI